MFLVVNQLYFPEGYVEEDAATHVTMRALWRLLCSQDEQVFRGSLFGMLYSSPELPLVIKWDNFNSIIEIGSC